MAKNKHNNKKIDINRFLDLPVRERLQIMSEVVAEANGDQQKLIEKYDRKFATAN